MHHNFVDTFSEEKIHHVNKASDFTPLENIDETGRALFDLVCQMCAFSDGDKRLI